MKVKDLLDLPFKEVLENYVLLYSPECGYYYGIVKSSLVDDIVDEYNIEEEYPESFDVECFIPIETSIECEDELIDYEKLERIMDNLGVSKKEQLNG